MQTMTVRWAYLSVGSNLGDPLANCRRGIEAVSRRPGIRLLACSPFYRTGPVDYLEQDWFVNAAVKIETELAPRELLADLHSVQAAMGRGRQKVRFGPRILDLDIIFYQDVVMQSETLTIPHPRMHKRRFVLQPICDIDPTIVHPVLQMNIKTLLNQDVVINQDLAPCLSS